MRPTAPLLDTVAASASASASPAPAANPDADQDSRSSSSMSSPVIVGRDDEGDESDSFNGSESSLSVPNIQAMHVEDGPDSAALDDSQLWVPVHRLPNEILISIFNKLEKPSEVLRCMLTCKRWARNAVELLWHRPLCSSWSNFKIICRAMQSDEGQPPPYFPYHAFIKRLNLATLSEDLNDGSVMPMRVCNRVERLTLTGCKGLHDTGLMALVENNASILALDVSGAKQITEKAIMAVAATCKRLQGLNISGCDKVSNESLVELAQSCRYIKRLKFNGCRQVRDEAVLAFAENCPNILEIDLHQCAEITDDPVTQLLVRARALRELRLLGCELITDNAFLSLPPERQFENLRILDLTACHLVTDATVQRIVESAPRLRNLVLSKCRLITDAAVYAISRLGRNLHYIHLGHCVEITDDSVKHLIAYCTRLRYIDLGCCVNLTDASVARLATLPKLKRIGLVKCINVTDESVLALARSHRPRVRRDAEGRPIGELHYVSTLERVHLSYCTSLTVKSIFRLVNACPRLTHLSLTGVEAFNLPEFRQFGREPPHEFTDNQRNAFCVFSGACVHRLRDYLNSAPEYELLRNPRPAPDSETGQHQVQIFQGHPGAGHGQPVLLGGGLQMVWPGVAAPGGGVDGGAMADDGLIEEVDDEGMEIGVAGIPIPPPPPPPPPAPAGGVLPAHLAPSPEGTPEPQA